MTSDGKSWKVGVWGGNWNLEVLLYASTLFDDVGEFSDWPFCVKIGSIQCTYLFSIPQIW